MSPYCSKQTYPTDFSKNQKGLLRSKYQKKFKVERGCLILTKLIRNVVSNPDHSLRSTGCIASLLVWVRDYNID